MFSILERSREDIANRLPRNLNDNDEINEWEKAIFYSDLKNKNDKQLHQIAFEQITETAYFNNEDRDIFLKLLWEQWEDPMNLRQFLQQISKKIQDFNWEWYDEWDTFFQKKGEYPYTWDKYKKEQKDVKYLKIALMYHSVHSRFAALRIYKEHYGVLEECTWLKAKFKVRLSIIRDDIVEKEIVESMGIIQENQILAFPPYIPAGRIDIAYERIRNK